MKQTSNVKNKANVAAGQRNPTPATKSTTTAQPVSTPDVGTTASKFSWWIDTRLSGRVLLPLRLFLGVTFLSASWRVHPYFYGADIVFVFAWIPLLLAGPCGSGLPSVDAQLVPRILRDVPPEWRRRLGPAFNFLLGVGADVVCKEIVQSEEMPTQATNRTSGQASAYNSRVSGYPQGVPQHIISG